MEFKKENIRGTERYGLREILIYEIDYPIFLEGVSGVVELNRFLSEVVQSCTSAISGVLFSRLCGWFDELSLYEQKFKFIPYKYTMKILASEREGGMIKMDISVMLSQGSRSLGRHETVLHWHSGFGCLCEG